LHGHILFSRWKRDKQREYQHRGAEQWGAVGEPDHMSILQCEWDQLLQAPSQVNYTATALQQPKLTSMIDKTQAMTLLSGAFITKNYQS
jgi:hypothetical protein